MLQQITSLVHQLVEAVLAVRTGFAEVDGTCGHLAPDSNQSSPEVAAVPNANSKTPIWPLSRSVFKYFRNLLKSRVP